MFTPIKVKVDNDFCWGGWYIYISILGATKHRILHYKLFHYILSLLTNCARNEGKYVMHG